MAAIHVPLAAEKVFAIGPFTVTNSMVFTWLVTLVLLGFAYLATRKMQRVPHQVQNIAEIMVDGLAGLVSSIAPPDKARAFLPIIASFFFFILFGNFLSLIPGVGSVGFFEEHQVENQTNDTTSNHQETTTNSEGQMANGNKTFVPYLRAMNSDLNTTMALAIVSVFMTHFLAIKYLGITSYIGKFISVNPIFLVVGLLELFGELTKIASLSFRLFGNIYAGEVLLTTATTSLFAYIVPIPFYFLEFLVAFVQALIFSMLTLVFMVILTEKHAAEH